MEIIFEEKACLKFENNVLSIIFCRFFGQSYFNNIKSSFKRILDMHGHLKDLMHIIFYYGS